MNHKLRLMLSCALFASMVSGIAHGQTADSNTIEELVITAEKLDNVLWVPSQAMFERDGKPFVYRKTPTGFSPHDVTLVKRTESQAVITGVNEGDTVALTNPSEQNKPAQQPQSATKAITK